MPNASAAPAPRTRRTASREADARVGERAHMLIWRSGHTQGAIADMLGIESTAFGKKLRGKNGWALQELLDLASTLDTTVSYLVGEIDDPGNGPLTTSNDLKHDGPDAGTGHVAPVTPIFGSVA